MRAALLIFALAVCALAQAPASPGLTADQIIEKSIAATGGREALEKSVSTYTKAVMESGSGETTRSLMEYWGKAPNKRLIVMNIEGYGEVQNGFDGASGWTSDPVRGLRDITGPELQQVKREAAFRPELKWRDLYLKTELAGKRKLGDAEVYVVKFTPREGRPETRFYDAHTFLLVRQDSFQNAPQGQVLVRTEMSDYRDVNGVKVPFRVVQASPMGEMVIRILEASNNLPIDDRKFARPAR